MHTQTVSAQHKTVLVQYGPLSTTTSPGNTGIHRQYTVHVSVRVYATFAHSVVGCSAHHWNTP